MATTMTLAQLITAVRQRTDNENASGIYTDSFITDDELTSYINQSYFELYDLLVGAYGEDYYAASPYTFTTDGTNDFYDLPSGFYKMLGVDVKLQGGSDQSYFTLKPFSMGERNSFNYPNNGGNYFYNNLRYRVQGDKIWLSPIPQAGFTVRLFYVPKMTQLVNASDTVDGVSGWTEYIIVDASIKCLVKEESDPKAFMLQKQELLKRIESISQNRDIGMPHTVVDVYQTGNWNRGGWC